MKLPPREVKRAMTQNHGINPRLAVATFTCSGADKIIVGSGHHVASGTEKPVAGVAFIVRPRALSWRVLAGFGACWLALCFLEGLPAWAQVGTTGSVPAAIQPEVPKDPLGRNTPKGTVLGFFENFSARDKFWFHPILSLRYGTTAAQIRTVIDLIRSLLEESRDVAPDSVRVHFLRFTQASFEVEVFAYVLSRNWKQFLEIQEGLLLRITQCFESIGVQIAFPLQAVLACDPTTSQRNALIDRSSP